MGNIRSVPPTFAKINIKQKTKLAFRHARPAAHVPLDALERFSRCRSMCVPLILGMVHARVGQIVLKCNVFKTKLAKWPFLAMEDNT